MVSSPRHALKSTTNCALNFPPKEQVGTRNEGMELWGLKKKRRFNFWTNRRLDSCANTATKNNLALDISIRTTNNNLASKVKPKSFVGEMTLREKSIYNAVVPTLTATIAFASSENNNYVWFGLRGRSIDADLEHPLFAVVVARLARAGRTPSIKLNENHSNANCARALYCERL